MWFIFALITVACWGTADLFYKKGSDKNDPLSHLKIVVMVGLVMGIHAVIYMLVKGLTFNPMDIVTYFPVSALYIFSMTIGYIGLRYIELSIASPIQNTSGALTAILCFFIFSQALSGLEIAGIAIISVGLFLLAVLEKHFDDKARAAAGETVEKKYRIGWLAILFPLAYCILDGLGTFADAIYLDEKEILSEDSALLAYEFTFFICAFFVFLFITFVKKEKFNPLKQKDKGLAAIFETAGQFFYVFAMSDRAIVAAPLVASYSIVSVLLSRIFIKEKLKKVQYLVIALVMVGIILLGIADEM